MNVNRASVSWQHINSDRKGQYRDYMLRCLFQVIICVEMNHCLDCSFSTRHDSIRCSFLFSCKKLGKTRKLAKTRKCYWTVLLTRKCCWAKCSNKWEFDCRVDEETAKRTDLEKVRRELDNQVEELKEDVEVERSARSKVEKQKRELSEVLGTCFWCSCSQVGRIVRIDTFT